MNKKTLLLLAVTAFSSFSCSSLSKDKIHFEAARPESIKVSRAALFPEGVAYNAKSGKFLLGSFKEGAVYEVAADGTPKQLVTDQRLNSVLGLSVDVTRNRLLVANSDIGSAIRPYTGGPAKLASLGIYDLTTGAALHFVDLGKLSAGLRHLANDLTIDSQGNAYVTDSFSPVIYKVDVDGNASVFLETDSFRGEGIGLNGIVFHPDGFLIVAKKDDGSLFRIPLNAPKSFSKIQMSVALQGADGLVLAGSDTLAVICNKTPNAVSNTVFSVASSDGWQSAQVVDQLKLGDVYPTTGTLKGDKLYVVHSRLNTLIAAPRSDQGKLDTTATIEQVGTIN